jgi:transcription initiation factor TFIID subunit 1, fungi type
LKSAPADSIMPHATESDGTPAAEPSLATDQDDENLINQILNDQNANALQGDVFDHDRPIDQGDKADDAVDYGDIDDDDLAEDEELPATNGTFGNGAVPYPNGVATNLDADVGYEDDPGDALDDLFGDSGAGEKATSPVAEKSRHEGAQMSHEHLPRLQIPTSSGSRPPEAALDDGAPEFRAVNYDDEQEAEEQDEEVLLQQRLFAEAQARREGNLPPAPPDDRDEFLQTVFPDYDQQEPVLYYRLFPPKKAFYVSKHVPTKPPKPIQPTKVSLELSQDQEKTFTLTHSTATWRADPTLSEQNGLVMCTRPDDDEGDNVINLESDSNDQDEVVGGLTMDDITMLCTDWNIDSNSEGSDGEFSVRSSPSMTEVVPESGDWEKQPSKRRKTSHEETKNYLPVMYESFPSLEDPEATTAYLSRRVPLDLNDPQLLVIEQQEDASAKPARPSTDFRKDVSGSLTKSMQRKYNISNDEAYDRLKDNHSHKIRSTIGNLTVEHGLPALKLQYPFYKVKLNPREA